MTSRKKITSTGQKYFKMILLSYSLKKLYVDEWTVKRSTLFCVVVCVVEDVEMCVGGWYDLSESS